MQASDKPLHPYEQSMLLVAMLFDAKNIDDILSILPEQQSLRMHKANEKFLKMPRNDRMTEIVFELRRMLLVDEHRIDWIHQSWIDDALAKEPPYLRSVIEIALKNGALKKSDEGMRGFVPLPVVFSMFIDQLIMTRQKTAIYEPVLMRLQSLKDDVQEDIFAVLGLTSLSVLEKNFSRERFAQFISKRGMTGLDLNQAIELEPFHDVRVRGFFLRELARFRATSDLSLAQFAGLLTIAMYLLQFKHDWQRSIILGMHHRFGVIVEAIIARAARKSIGNYVDHVWAELIATALMHGR